MPDTAWGTYEGNHGPWRHRYDLRGAWWQIANTQTVAFLLGLASCCISPNRRALIVAGLALTGKVLFFLTHYWLVD